MKWITDIAGRYQAATSPDEADALRDQMLAELEAMPAEDLSKDPARSGKTRNMMRRCVLEQYDERIKALGQ